MTTSDRLRRTLIALFVLGCLAAIGWGCSQVREVDANGDTVAEERDPDDVAVSGDEELADSLGSVPPGLPSESEIVEQTFPSEGSQILQQQQVGVDLGPGYRVVDLYVNRTLVPRSELTRRDELNQAFFTPGDDRTFEELPPGRLCAQADVAAIDDLGTVVRQIEWCFEVL